MKAVLRTIVGVWLGLSFWASAAWAEPLGTAFTYQGRLRNAGSPANGSYDLQVKLFADAGGSAQVGGTICSDSVSVSEGLFTVTLDFGVQFDANARWLEIGVRSDSTPGNCSSGAYTTLAPRQRLTAAPFSLSTRGLNVDAAGNVGIGTSAPQAALHVQRGSAGVGPDGNSIAVFEKDSPAYLSFLTPLYEESGILFGKPIIGPASGGILYDTAAVLRGLEFRTNNNITQMVISGGGNVGIGTTSPTSKLDVNGTIRGAGVWAQGGGSGLAAPALRVDNTNPTGIGIFSTSNSSDGNLIIANNGGGPLIRGFGGGCCPVFQVSKDGRTDIYGPSFNLAVTMGPGGFLSDSGYVRVHDGVGYARAGMYVDSTNDPGIGVLFADVKAFRTPDPDDDAHDLWYAALEGPEAAMYVRGTAQLANGRAHVDLPDHFSSLAMLDGMTITLTPGSFDSRGLAWANKSLEGFDVGELDAGQGDYRFDWEVKAVRREHADWRVTRPWDEVSPVGVTREAQWEARVKTIEARRAKADTSTSKARP